MCVLLVKRLHFGVDLVHNVELEFVLLLKDFGPLLELKYDKLLLLDVLEANEIDYLFHEHVRFALVHTLCNM